MIAQLQGMQKPLKEDEELVVLYQNGTEKIRVFELAAVSAPGSAPDRSRSSK